MNLDAKDAGPDSNTEELVAKEFVFNRSRQRVLEEYTSLAAEGVQHQLNQYALNLPPGIAEMPVMTKLEELWFGDQQYYRAWCSFDFNYSEETRKLIMQNEIEDNKSNQGLNMGFGDEMRISKSKGTEETGSKARKNNQNNQNHQTHLDSLLSKNIANKGDFTRTSLKPFSEILNRLKANSPFVDLIIEAKVKYPEPSLKESFDWLLQTLARNDGLAEPILIQTSTQLIPGTPVTPIIMRQLISKPEEGGHNLQPGFNFSTAAEEAANGKDIPKPTPQVSNMEGLKQTGTLGYLISASLAAEGKPTTDQELDVIAYFIPVGPTQSATQLSKANTQSEEGRDKEAKPHHKVHEREPVYRGNADSTTALVAKESKESISEEKDIKITKIQLQRGEKNKVVPHAKSQSVHITSSPQTSHNTHTIKNYRTAGGSNSKSKITGKSKVFKETRTYTGKEENPKNSIWNLSRLGRVFQKTDKNINLLRKKEQVTTTFITTVSRGDAFVSHSHVNLNLITRYISEYKHIKKMDVVPDDKNHSVTASTKSNSSKGAYLFKLVHNTLENKRRGSLVYWFTLGLALFTLFFALAYQITISGLKTFNQTNQDSFLLVTKFITFERRLIEGVELQESLYEHAYSAWTPSLWTLINNSFNVTLPAGISSSEFLLYQMSSFIQDITSSLQDIIKYTTSLSSRGDVGDINQVVFQTQTLNYWERRYQVDRK